MPILPRAPLEISPPPTKRRRVPTPAPSEFLPKAPPPCENAFSDPQVIRIYSWNINGIFPFLPSSTPSIRRFFSTASENTLSVSASRSTPSLRACLERWSFPSILFLQEVKISSRDTTTLSTLRRVINTDLQPETLSSENRNDGSPPPLYDIHFSLPRDSHNATGFGGKIHGVATIVNRNLHRYNPVCRRPDWDLEGRILALELTELGLVAINVYAVNGTEFPYRNPATGKVIGTRHDFKRAFHTKLANEIRAYEYAGWGVVLGGDMNVAREARDSFPQLRIGKEHVVNRRDFEEKFMTSKEQEHEGLEMMDTFRLVRGGERKFTYRPRGKGRKWGDGGDRVDLMLISKELQKSVREADILDEEKERGPSDHVPLWVELEVERREKREKENVQENDSSSIYK